MIMNAIKSKYMWLIDPGHGGVIDGVPQTKGKRSPIWNDGRQYFEGEGNRQIAAKIINLCKSYGIEAIDIVNSDKDIKLSTRVSRANKLHTENGKRCIYVSVHSDAFSKESAHGWSVYTSVGQTKSDKVATIFQKFAKEMFPEMNFRTDDKDGDPDKEAHFYVLKKTNMPSILTENFFMTNEYECKEILMTEEGQNRIAQFHFEAIQYIERYGI